MYSWIRLVPFGYMDEYMYLN